MTKHRQQGVNRRSAVVAGSMLGLHRRSIRPWHASLPCNLVNWNNPWKNQIVTPPRDLVSTVNSCSSLQSRGCRCTKGKGKVNRCPGSPFPSFVHALQPYLDCKRLQNFSHEGLGLVCGAERSHTRHRRPNLIHVKKFTAGSVPGAEINHEQ